MDFASIIGFVGGVGVLSFLIHEGGGLERYYSEHAVIVIFGGAMTATLIRFEMGAFLSSFPTAIKTCFGIGGGHSNPRDLIAEIAGMAQIVRKSGPVGLDKATPHDAFLAKGVRYVADGFDENFIRETLERERDLNLHRLEMAAKVFRGIGDCAPAFGMIGTLIGMVQMFAEMSDPSKLGTFMAIALLATLYGAVVANFFFLPIADKITIKFNHDELNQTLVIDGVLQLRAAKSPAVIKEMLLAYLPEKHRAELAEAAA
ncbi:motility protein A [Hansschlegelia zhihuaiae]|uniref:Flagellar motor protein PomA n=1 Tax=Hansschlegelia zhihuaiae TaxID=405005 RepID=A0A4Q0MGP8_9HYPH|nr:MotA/TolQ/ExbB proton channel family protein [Hansschlegelia zhihuaiae]RXF72741.1 flagellar motor protein PomA [Hansschlegelia zhihuaiae]